MGQDIAFPTGIQISLMDEIPSIYLSTKGIRHQGFPLGSVLSPWEPVCGSHFRIPIPGVTAKDLIGTLT